MELQVNWRNFVKDNLKGHILEIGALCQPYPINEETTIYYQDRLNTEDLKALTILDGNVIQDKIVEVAIVSDAEIVPVPDNTYDALITSHIFEHLKNPIKALLEWVRVIKIGGYIYIVLPDKRFIFDKERDETAVLHMIYDYKNDVQEISIDHYIDFYTKVDHLGGDIIEKEYLRQKEIAGANIHVHCFTYESMMELLQLNINLYNIVDSKLFGGDICILLQKI